MTFAAATQVRQLGDAVWVGEIQPDWDIFEVTNGGYLMAMAARAMSEEAAGRSLVSITAHFTNPATPGKVSIEVEALKVGGVFSTLRADLRRDDRLLLTVLAGFAEPERQVGDAGFQNGSPPQLPPPSECVLVTPARDGPLPPPFSSKVEVRVHPEDAGFGDGKRTGAALIRGWFRLRGGGSSGSVGGPVPSARWSVARIGRACLRAIGRHLARRSAQSQPGSCGEHFDTARGVEGRRDAVIIRATGHLALVPR